MRISVLLGSPRKNGNTKRLINEFLKHFEGSSVDIIDSYSVNVSGCRGCDACKDTGVCVFNDDMCEIIKKLKKADMIVLAFPLYFDAMPAPMKMIIDRMQPLYNLTYGAGKRPEINKKGIALITAGSKAVRDYSLDNTCKYFLNLLGASFEGAFVVDRTDIDEGSDKFLNAAKAAVERVLSNR